jgi:long-chain fatty acid transport protein
MVRKFLQSVSWTVLCALVFISNSYADEYHYTNLLIGDRASGLAGAYTAISDDATGLYYNPAGVAFTTGRNVSASVNAYYNVEKTYKSVIGGNGWNRKSSSLLPNYFGVVQPLGGFRVGLSYAVPDSIMEDQEQTFHNLPLSPALAYANAGASISTYSINFNNESNTYNFGPTIAKDITDDLSAGLTIYYYQRKALWILNQVIKTTNGGYELTNQYYHTNEKGVRPILGFMWSPAEKVSIGLSLSKVFIDSSDSSNQTSQRREGLPKGVDTDNDGNFDTIVNNDVLLLPDGSLSSNVKRKYPTQVGLGVAWFPSQSLLLTGDLKYYSKVDQQNAEAVTNIALGAEYYFSRNWAMRTGFFTDYANTPEISSGSINQNEHIDLYGGTLSLSHFTRNTSVTLGGGYTFGSGDAQIIGNDTRIQDAESRGWMLFLSSSYSY